MDLSEVQNYPLLTNHYAKLDMLKRQLDIEVQSYDELKALADDKVEMWASRPAIQPISNKQLDRLHMTYGARLHPIFHVFMDHKGLDFTASKGTPVYATGDGEIITAHFSASYGNVIYLDHGHDYETRYAHLSQFNVKLGQKVKRGQVIGYVGSTGNSVSSHLHYEVLFKGQHVNPINFFQRDLSNKEYEKLIEIGSRQFHALDWFSAFLSAYFNTFAFHTEPHATIVCAFPYAPDHDRGLFAFFGEKRFYRVEGC